MMSISTDAALIKSNPQRNTLDTAYFDSEQHKIPPRSTLAINSITIHFRDAEAPLQNDINAGDQAD